MVKSGDYNQYYYHTVEGDTVTDAAIESAAVQAVSDVSLVISHSIFIDTNSQSKRHRILSTRSEELLDELVSASSERVRHGAIWQEDSNMSGAMFGNTEYVLLTGIEMRNTTTQYSRRFACAMTGLKVRTE